MLGLGNIGAIAGKPVMEGKANLFKQFADLDVFDLEVGSENPDDVIKFCQLLEPTVGGINLEDIRAPDCFYIEETLRKTLQDSRSSTTTSTAPRSSPAPRCSTRSRSSARTSTTIRVVFSGAGAAAIATAEHYVRLGVQRENIIMCDRARRDLQGAREATWIRTRRGSRSRRTRERSPTRSTGADVFVGLSVAGAVTREMVEAMAPKPIIFALANPVPEILPDEVRAVRDDAIIATGRSDYPNQVNNVLGFPFIFRGALDVRATRDQRGDEDGRDARARVLAKEDVPEQRRRALRTARRAVRADYLIPFPFDPRVLLWVAPAVAWAAVASGAANDFVDLDDYRERLEARLGRARGVMRGMINRAISDPKRVVFPEGDEPKIIRAAHICVDDGIAMPILLGDPQVDRAEGARDRTSRSTRS